ncbi:MAG: sorbosone dehydrogenase family protein [Geminicoccaceae bacterium]
MRSPSGRSAGLALACAVVAGTLAGGDAAALPAGFVDELVTGGLSAPTAIAVAPDGRIFVTEQTGAVRVIRGGSLLGTPFATFNVDTDGERGLLGIAFDPNFPSNDFVYVYHTVPGSPARNRISRMKAAGDQAQAGSTVTILDLDPLSDRKNHNGGAIHFGPDGKLYVAVGENANTSNAQSLANRLGKILRLNPDGTIPGNNPTSFAGISGSPTGANRAIWAVGLRNPFTFAFQPHSGRMFINDVGKQTWEEINVGGAGRNYGWPGSEGPTSIAGHTSPAFAYQHQSGNPTGCAIAGGTFYNPSRASFPAQYEGKYFFADLCGNWIHYIDPSSPQSATLFQSGLKQPVGLAVGPDGSLLYVQRGNGQLRRIRYDGSSSQAILASTTKLEVREGKQAMVTLRLAAQPDQAIDAAVKMAMFDHSISVTPATVRFTPSSWTGKTITIKAGQDGDRSDDGGTVEITAPGLAATRVVVTAVDDERPAEAPRAVISEPQNGATVSGTNAEFFGDGISSAGAVRAQFVIDNVTRYVDLNDEGHYHINGNHNLWDTTQLANGDHLLNMRVYDALGRWGSHTIKVKVQN